MKPIDSLMELLVANPLTQACEWCDALPYDECVVVQGSGRHGIFRVHEERTDAAQAALRKALESALALPPIPVNAC